MPRLWYCRFDPPAFAAGEAEEIAARLTQEDGRRLSPEVVAALAPYVPEAAAAFAVPGVRRYFQLAGFAPYPAARRMMALLPRARQSEFITEALARPLANDISDHGAVLAIVGPAMGAEQRQIAAAKILSAPSDLTLILLSQFVDVDLAAMMPDLSATVLAAVQRAGGMIGSLAFVDWSRLLEALPQPERAAVVEEVLQAFGSTAGSSGWLDLMAELIPYMTLAQKAEVADLAVRKGRVHHDQSALLDSLGILPPLLSDEEQESASRRLASRVDAYLAGRPVVEDPRRTVLALPLLRFASPAVASTVAEGLFAARLKTTSGHIDQLCRVLPYLGKESRHEAIGLLKRWIEALEWSPSEPTLMEAAEPWLGRPIIEATADRLLAQAAAESEPRLAAFNLAHLLRLLGRGEAAALSGRLVEQALAQPEWDDQWCFIVRAAFPHLSEELVADSVYREAMRRPQTAYNRLELVLEIAACREGMARVAILGAALDLAPPSHWEVERLPLVLEVLPAAQRRELIADCLRTRTGERRVRQLRCIDALAPWLAIESRGTVLEVFDAIWDVGAWWP